MESDCMLRFGFKALMKSILCTKQLNLFLHFLSTSKCFISTEASSHAHSCSVWQWCQRLATVFRNNTTRIDYSLRFIYIYGYIQMMIIQEFFHVFEIQIGMNEFNHRILALLKQQ